MVQPGQREGKWKLASAFPTNQWELHDLEADRGETINLATKYPDVVKKLSLEYLIWVSENNVVLDFTLIKPKSPVDIKIGQ